MDENLINHWKEQWNIWRYNPNEYNKYLKLLQHDLYCKSEFKDFGPISLYGDWTNTINKIFIASLNPSSRNSSSNKPGNRLHYLENKQTGFLITGKQRREYTWEMRRDFSLNLFNILNENHIGHRHLTTIGTVISLVHNEINADRKRKYELLNKHVVCGEIIPYYSESFAIGNRVDKTIIKEYFSRIKNFIIKGYFSTFILNGINCYEIFLELGLLTKLEDNGDNSVPYWGSNSSIIKVKMNDISGFIVPFISNGNMEYYKKLANIMRKEIK